VGIARILIQGLEGVTGMKEVGSRVNTMQDLRDKNERFLKYAASQLNEVVDYAMQSQRNIQVN